MINKQIIQKLPSSLGVYIFKKEKQILYIGKSVNIRARIFSHLENSRLDPKENLLINEANEIKYFLVNSEFEALILEAKLIKKYQPKYNTRWRDDKNFLWIKITVAEQFPKVFLVRKENDNQSVYIGPFTSKKEAEMILRETRKIAPFCSDKKINIRPCFYSKIGLCNPCPNFIFFLKNKKIKKKLAKEYQRNIRLLIEILKGNTNRLLNKINKKIKFLVDKEKFEEAIFWRKILKAMNNLLNKKIDLNTDYKFESLNQLKMLEKFIAQYFSIKKLDRIEGFDVSNLSFQEATASMVVFTEGIADLSQYRRFKIKTVEKSDTAMLAEAIRRRLNNNWPLPQLILIDGGINQLKVSSKVIKQKKLDIPIISIAKNPDRVFIIKNKKIIKIPLRKIPGWQILSSIRDESHRFARKYHLFLRRKKIIN